MTGPRPLHAGARMHRRHLGHFWRHLLEMFGVMVAGMIVSAAMFLAFVRMTWDEATMQHPLASLLVIAAGMTVPTVVWMLHRGMSSRHVGEMGAAMAIPVIPFLCLVRFGITETAWCGAYCIAAIVTMVGLMFYRRDEYSMDKPAG